MRATNKKSVKYARESDSKYITAYRTRYGHTKGFQDEITVGKNTTGETLASGVEKLKHLKNDNAAIDGDNLEKKHKIPCYVHN